MTKAKSAPGDGGVSLARRHHVNPFLNGVPADSMEPSRYITEAEFSQIYSAVEFAWRWRAFLDVHLTITWALLGVDDEAGVQAAFAVFLKCLRAWLSDREFPAAWIYAHECGRERGLHTHLAIHIPANAGPGRMWRKVFRAWVLGWAQRTAGGPAPRSTRVSDNGGRACQLGHWRNFHYLVKGVDPEAVVVPARILTDRRDVRLTDLVAFAWEDPGHVSMKRVGCSRSLGPERRAVGYPPWKESMFRPTEVVDIDVQAPVLRAAPSQTWTKHDWAELEVLVRRVGPVVGFAPPAVRPEPFRSRYECGVRDVRRLYPVDFVEIVQQGYGEVAMKARQAKRQAAAARAAQEAQAAQEAAEAEIRSAILSLDL